MRGSPALAFLASLFLGNPTPTDQGTGSIEGAVREGGIGGGPLEGALVTVQGTSLRTLTDKKGHFALTGVPAGRARVSVVFVGFAPAVREVVVQQGKVTTVDFVLSMPSIKLDDIAAARPEAAAEGRQLAKSVYSPGVVAAAPSRGYRFRRAGVDFNTEEYGHRVDNDWMSPTRTPLSTFSIDVDVGSYGNVRRFLRQGTLPPKDAVRVEEMVNYFRYDYAAPAARDEHPFSVTTELAPAPWKRGHQLALIGLQSQRLSLGALPPNNLVFLIDVSGSMDEPHKLPLVKAAFRLLVNELRDQDRVAIVVYAGAAGQVLPPTRGSDKERILQAIDGLEAGGSTAGGAGIQLAYRVAREQFMAEGNNRVILATDGDFNVGVSSEGDLVRMIEERRSDGVFLTVLGFGTGNLKDAKMEQLANKGNGHYAYVDDLLEAKKVFVQELGATLYTIAKDVKIQVEFNPARVKSYRLIGYENRLLADRDFNDDTKDAGEMGAGHSVTALYEIVPAGSEGDEAGSVDPLKYQARPEARGSADWFTVKVRYKAPNGTTSRLLERVVRHQTPSPSSDFRFASAVAAFGMLLRESEYRGDASYESVLAQARSARGDDAEGYRAEFIRLVETAKALTRREDGVVVR